MTNPVYDYLVDLVDANDKADGTTDTAAHRMIVNGVLEFVREDLRYIAKYADESLLANLTDRLKEMQ